MIYMYGHGGSKNHGCEAIVRSTLGMLNEPITLFSLCKEEDLAYHLDDIVKILKDDDTIPQKPELKYYLAALEIKLKHKTSVLTSFRRSELIKTAKKGDIFIAIGGDNYCYAGNEQLGDINYLLHKKKAKTVLWGCSIEPSILDDRLLEDLRRYDLITVRESISYNALAEHGLKNIVLCADPAFTLPMEKPDKCLELNEKYVGINASPLILNYGNSDIILENYKKVIEYVLSETDFTVLLIPHVVTAKNNDMKVLTILKEAFKDEARVKIIEDDNCMKLKYIISKCTYFIGARTHSTIAAYSTNVPTIVMGYSVKSRGIAKDIFGTEENYVVSTQSLTDSDELLKSFRWLVQNDKNVRNHLTEIIPEYIKRAYLAQSAFEKIGKTSEA